jgi:hypothetical protein
MPLSFIRRFSYRRFLSRRFLSRRSNPAILNPNDGHLAARLLSFAPVTEK